MPASHLTEAEWTAAFAQFGVLQPLAYSSVSTSHFSLARLYGGAKVEGQNFYYIDATDELLRSDVFKWIEKRRADAAIAQRNAQAVAAAVRQGVVFAAPGAAPEPKGKT